MSSQLTHPKYRPDIDGLRAIAILSVIGFHAFPSFISGGFVGVDVFFVISGYLISTIIFSSLEINRFSFIEFYSRRIKRIFPALILVLVACYVFGWFSLLTNEYELLGKHIAAAAGFVLNFVLWNEAGYFDEAAALKPLLHLWSLSIEEQFYIFWPLLLFLVRKWRLNFLALTLLIAIGSFAINVATRSNTTEVFYSPLSRFWELMTGGVLAYIELHHPVLESKLPNVKSVFGFLCIIGTTFLVIKTFRYPGWWATLPTAGAFLMISAGQDAWLNRTVLANRAMVYIGLISYPLYLWHWPLLSFAHIVENQMPSPRIRIAAVLISFVLAWLTYMLVERPVRFGKHGQYKTIVLCVLMVAIGGSGYWTFESHGLTPYKRASPIAKNGSVLEQMSLAKKDFTYPQFSFDVKTMRMNYLSGQSSRSVPFVGDSRVEHAWPNFDGKTLRINYLPGQSSRSVLFVGDSHMEQYWPRVELINAAQSTELGIKFATLGGCASLPNTFIIHYGGQGTDCGKFYSMVMEIARQPDIAKVVIGCFWEGYPPGVVSDKSIAALGKDISILVGLGKEVYLILSNPVDMAFNPDEMSISRFNLIFRNQKDKSIWRSLDTASLRLKSEPLMNKLRLTAQQNGAKVIDPFPYICGPITCATSENSDPIYKDDNHLRASFARERATFMDEILFSK